MVNNWLQEIESGDLVFYGGSGKSLGCFIFESSEVDRWGSPVGKLISFVLPERYDEKTRSWVKPTTPSKHVTIASHPKRMLKIDRLPPVVMENKELLQAFIAEQERLRRINGRATQASDSN